ncbi:MAG TPA: BTAD domain-containing putative transcriptional regulator, partial [Gaiellaceae bacterium]
LALWRGRALGDVEGAAWAQPEAARWEELRLAAIEERFEALIAAGAAGELVADLAATVREYPWREQLTAQLMVALYRCGRQREALEAFDHLATALREELGLEPSPAVRELERSILGQDPLLDPPARFDGTPSLVGVRTSRSFVGRVAELEQLEAAVHRNRVVTIVGAGGTGKTRLADQLLQRLGARYGEGACFVELGTVRAPALVADHIASRLGLVDSAETGTVDPADLVAIGELTRLVGGNPLAIELVARLTGTAAPTMILDRAREMLGSGANGSGAESRPDRSAPLRTTLALSHEQLEPTERILFRRAGVFAAGFGVAALEAVAGGDGFESQGVAATLRGLEAAALVYPTGTAHDRRRMLDTVREEALDRLRDAGELEATLGRQTTYYLQLAQRCDRALRGHGQDEARDTLDLELDNLRDVLDRLLAAGAGETAAGLTAALTDYWYLRGHWAEARRWVDRSVAATAGTRSLARSRMLRSHANQAGFSGMHNRMAELDEALAISREHGSREDEVWTLLFMAGAAGSTGDHARMRLLLTDADWIIDQLDDPWMRAVRCSYVAATDVTLDPSDAHDAQLRAHRELLALGDRAWAGRCLWFAGSIARRRHDLA